MHFIVIVIDIGDADQGRAPPKVPSFSSLPSPTSLPPPAYLEEKMYYPPQSQQPHDKYEGPIPVAVPPPGVPVTPRQHQHQHYSPYQAASVRPQSHGGTVRWDSGLCHCCDDPANCMITAICPCITFGQIAEILNKGEPSCATSGAIYGLLLGFTGCACLFSCFYRSKLRAQYDLEESPFADCLVHFCCETCALCQEYRELRSRGFDMGIGWAANIDRQNRGITVAPGVPSGMTR